MRRTCITVALTAILIALAATAGLLDAADYPTPKADPHGLGFYVPAVTTQSYPLTTARKVKNVILCVGDGMGLNQVT